MTSHKRSLHLTTVVASFWWCAATSLAVLGPSLPEGGLGSNAHHVALGISVVALAGVLWTARKLKARWFGGAVVAIAMFTALASVGLRDVVISQIWEPQCQAGKGAACHNLASLIADGRVPRRDWREATQLHGKACGIGGPGTDASCDLVERLGIRGGEIPDTWQEHADALDPRQLALRWRTYKQRRMYRECHEVAQKYELRGEIAQALEVYEFACLGVVESCWRTMESEFHDLRLEACGLIDSHCERTDPHPNCGDARRRCDEFPSTWQVHPLW